MPQQRLFVSDSFSVLQDALVTAVQTLKGADPLTPLTILVPTDLLATQLRRTVAKAGRGHLRLSTFTLSDLAYEIAGEAFAREGYRPLPFFAATLLAKKLLGKADKSNYFASREVQPGLPRNLLATIIDLKQARVGPRDLRTFIDQASLQGAYRHKIESLHALYESYANYLGTHRFYDDEDLLERAVSLVHEHPEIPTLFLYGFFNFTSVQRRLVEAIVKERDALVFYPWRSGSAYENATPLLGWFASLGCHYTALSTVTTKQNNLVRLQTRLFESTSLWPSENHSQVDSSVMFISAPGESREAREIGRLILDLVREENLHFADIAVFTHDPVTYKPLLRETLTGLGIPCVFSQGLPLLETRAGQSFVLLCQVLAEDYSRSRMIEFLHTARPPFAELLGEQAAYAQPARWERLAAQAGIVKGTSEWRERLAWLSANDGRQNREAPPPFTAAEQQSLPALIEFIEKFIFASADFPRVNTWQGWVEKVGPLFSTYVSPSAYTHQLLAALAPLGQFDWLGESLSLREWYRMVVETLQATAAMPVTGELRDGVFIGSLDVARGIPFRAVIIPGLVEGKFPRTFRQDPLLLDAERQHIGEMLLCDLRQQSRLSEEEKLTFTVAIRSATERLILTYPRQDQASGRAQLPSTYLLRAVEALSGQSAALSDLKQWSKQIPLSPLYVGPPTEALDVLEFHLASVEHARAAESTTPLGYLPLVTPFFSRTLNAVYQRLDVSRFTPYDGMIEDEAVKTMLLGNLFPAGMTLSASALETYARCPFRYFLTTALGLSPQGDLEQRYTIDPRERGALLHAILYDFFVRLQKENRLPITTQPQQELFHLLTRVADGHFQAFARTKATGLSLFWEFEQEQMREQLSRLLTEEYQNDQTFFPTAFEAHFGVAKGETPETFFTAGTVRLALGDGEEISLHGRIDRIDVSADTLHARIIDYKSGKPIRGRFVGGTALQLPVYLFAARALRPDLQWVSAEYVHLNSPRVENRQTFTREEWDDTLVSLRAIVGALTKGMREGCFVPTPESCGPCPFAMVCGSQVGSFTARKKTDPRLDFLRQVRAFS